MLTLAVFADDLTGALDTGVQFAAAGVKTAVTVGLYPPEDCTVSVCDMETRHVSPQEAYARTAEAVRHAAARGATFFYVKTDSGLRGNIGAELAALLAERDQVLFAPSYPENGRVTVGGVHLVDGVPVSQSLFGRDARNPVRHDRVADILRENADVPVFSLRAGEDIQPEMRGVLVADAVSDAELAGHAETARRAGITRFAGCAGFAKQLERTLALPRETLRQTFSRAPVLTVCGSISPVSLSQLQTARAAGVPCFPLRDTDGEGFTTVREALRNEGQAIVASAFDDADIRENDAADLSAEAIAARLGEIAQRGTAECACGLFVIGGDTLMAAVRALGNCAIVPAYEISSGVVACTLVRGSEERLLITKSGSFGTPHTITEVLHRFAAAEAP